eukprot:GHRQ01010257.1.p2 GENE.GHRQ01010257.1~~GHRQ01010257.1.p2  ORF type:complete len:141 (+),score=6.64 GHRQ01010257.1:254-676(+)
MDPGLMLTLAPELRPFRPQVEVCACRSLFSIMKQYYTCCERVAASLSCSSGQAKPPSAAAPNLLLHCPCLLCCFFRLQAYANAKIQRFAYMFANRLNPNLTKEQIDYVAADTMHNMAAMQEPIQMMPQQNLRLVLRHDCL